MSDISVARMQRSGIRGSRFFPGSGPAGLHPGYTG